MSRISSKAPRRSLLRAVTLLLLLLLLFAALPAPVALAAAPAAVAPAATPTAVATTGSTPAANRVQPAGALAGGLQPGGTRIRPRHAGKGSGKLSSGAILAAVIAGLIALACIVWGIFRWSAVEPRWTLPLRHALAEAAFRTAGVWAEFTDWIRLGH